MRPSRTISRVSGVTGILLLSFATVALAQGRAPSSSNVTTAAGTIGSVPGPLPSSIVSGGVTYLTLPMGHLQSPANTFWQLFSQSGGPGTLRDETTALAVATNGPIILASVPANPPLVAIDPSNDLRYSALLSLAKSWQPVAPVLSAVRSLARSGSSIAAITLQGGTSSFALSTNSTSTFSNVISVRSGEIITPLGARANFGSCKPLALVAVGALSPQSYAIGDECTGVGSSPIAIYTAHGWHLPRLLEGADGPGSLLAHRYTVLALMTTVLGTEGLVEFSTATGEVVSRFSLTATSMTVGRSAHLAPGATVAGQGTLADGSLWILTRSDNHEVGTIFRSNGSALTTPVLDATEAALAEAPTGSIEAVEVTRGGNAVAELTLSSADRWQLARSIYLTIPYGSSG